MKKIIYLFLLLLPMAITAQVKVGENPTVIGQSSILELESPNKAFVVTRVPNTAAIAFPVNGMIVYDLSANAFKFYQNNAWVTFSSSNPSSGGTSDISSITCNTASGGNLVAGMAASGVTQTLTATVTAAGTYSISATANGVVFSGSGTFAGTGPQPVVLTASGTPLAVGSDVFTINTTPGCSFTRITNQASSGGTAIISSFTCNTASSGTLTLGTSVSGVTQTITADVTTAGTYDITATANGVTFSGSGTFSGTGPQNIVLTATGVPAAAGSYAYTINTNPSCSFIRTAGQPSSGGDAIVSSFTCNTASTGTLTTGTVITSVTQTITANVTTAGSYNITATINGVTFAGSGTFAGTGSQDILLTASGTPTVAGTNTFTLSTTPGCSFTRTVLQASSGGSAVVSGFVCNTASAGDLYENVPISGATQTITATVTTAGTYNISTTANGITFSASGTFAGTGAQNIVLTATGVPTAAGTSSFTLNTTPNCSFNRSVYASTVLADITSPTGKIWMDRNLGAQRVATSISDNQAYGFLYQWGRGNDGHQVPTSSTTSTLSSTDAPGLSFITINSGNLDWRSPQNNSLWQGVSGTNNPCPSGYRLPSAAEWTAETATFSSSNTAGAFASVLKIPQAPYRRLENGVLEGAVGTRYWSSTVTGTTSTCLNMNSSSIVTNNEYRANGFSVRCIKESTSSGGTSAVATYTCNTASAGTMTQGTAVSGVTQTITANVSTAGTYNIVASNNGVTFSASGTFAGTGSQNVVLTATGTPTVIGANTFTLSTTPGCSFTRTVNSATSGGTAVVSGFNCSTASVGDLYQNVPISGATQTITATVTTAGTYNISTTTNGITFSGSGTFAGTGSQNIVLTATGTPTTSGSNSFTLSTTPNCSFTRSVLAPTTVVEVTTPTGKVWMDRNLGAQRVATSVTDNQAYGFLYQWGRGNDGHQVRTSATRSTLSTTDAPGHADFITSSSSPNDWRSPQNNSLWQGVSGTNNPCPSGFRLPTQAEWTAERANFNTISQGFSSPLKLVATGSRALDNIFYDVNQNGVYNTSTVSGTGASIFILYSTGNEFLINARAGARAVRCIKN